MIEQALKNTLGFGVKEFIEKAIEGGWEIRDFISTYGVQRIYGHRVTAKYISVAAGSSTTRRIPTDLVLLDPQAWKAVGKSEGWKNQYCKTFNCLPCHEHLDYHHRFIDELYNLTK